MRFKTKEGERLKRLASRYARAVERRSWMGSMDPECHEDVKTELKRARKALYDAIDDLTSTDLTPRSVLEM